MLHTIVVFTMSTQHKNKWISLPSVNYWINRTCWTANAFDYFNEWKKQNKKIISLWIKLLNREACSIRSFIKKPLWNWINRLGHAYLTLTWYFNRKIIPAQMLRCQWMAMFCHSNFDTQKCTEFSRNLMSGYYDHKYHKNRSANACEAYRLCA